MTTPEESLRELSKLLNDVEKHDYAVREFGMMFVVLLNHPEIEDARDGIRGVCFLIAQHGKSLIEAHVQMRAIVRRLRNL